MIKNFNLVFLKILTLFKSSLRLLFVYCFLIGLNMNILVIGSGAREHSLINKLHSDTNLIWAYPGNPGIFQLALKTNLLSMNFDEIFGFCNENIIDLVVIGPEQPLAEGIVDYLEQKNIAVFGPSKLAAEIESSKVFSKDLMQKYGIPTARFQSFSRTDSNEEITKFANSLGFPIVVKADGLAAGKGVAICNDLEEFEDTIKEYFSGKFNEASQRIVIEEFMEGEEASIFAITDGNDYVLLPSAQDHKRIGEGDTGLNTGGMGAFSPAPIVTDEILEKVESTILKPILLAMKSENRIFKGCLYVGLMIDKNSNSKVVEFNARFGDPETEAVLELVEGDFAALLYSSAIGKIDKTAIQIVENKFASCVILASEGYPESFKKGFVINGLNTQIDDSVKIFHSGTSEKDNQIVTNGGRVLAIVSSDNSLKQSLENVYKMISNINFENKYFRNDIGHRALNNNN